MSSPAPVSMYAPQGPPARPNERVWFAVGGGGLAVVILVIFLFVALPQLFPPASTSPPTVAAVTRGGYQTGSGQLNYCGAGSPSPTTSWLCFEATAGPGSGGARGWYQFQTDFNFTNLTGAHSYYPDGSLSLAPGVA